MGVWLGPRGTKELVIDLSSFTAKAYAWNNSYGEEAHALAPTINGQTVSISKAQYAVDQAGIAVSEQLDLTKYSKIVVDFSAISGNGHVAVYVSTSNTDFVKTRDTYQYDFSGSSVELDVSSYGACYFGIALEVTNDGPATKSITINSITATA